MAQHKLSRARLHTILINAVTDWDRSQLTHRPKQYNKYALPQYFQAVEKVEKHLERGMELDTAIDACFCGAMADTLKSVVKAAMQIADIEAKSSSCKCFICGRPEDKNSSLHPALFGTHCHNHCLEEGRAPYRRLKHAACSKDTPVSVVKKLTKYLPVMRIESKAFDYTQPSHEWQASLTTQR